MSMRKCRLVEELDKAKKYDENAMIRYELSNCMGNETSLKHWIGKIIGPQNVTQVLYRLLLKIKHMSY